MHPLIFHFESTPYWPVGGLFQGEILSVWFYRRCKLYEIRITFFEFFQVSRLREPFLERVLVANATRTRFKRVLVAIIQ